MPIRYKVVAFAVVLAAITYFDRVCISVLAPSIMRDLGLTRIQMSYVFSAFTLAYALFEIPTAWWADRIGSRKVLTRIVVWWSSFTILTGSVFTYPTLLTVRFLFGAGEAGAWPNVARVFSRWIPGRERGTVQGVFFAGAHLAGGVTPLLVTALHERLSWRAIFVMFGLLGFVWVGMWWLWFRDEPSQHGSISATERALIEKGRGLPSEHGNPASVWREALRSRSVIALCAMYFANTYGFYFLITWLPTYLREARGFASTELSLFAGLPLLLSVAADLSGGWTTDVLARRFGLRLGRALVGGAGYAAATVMMLAAATARDGRAAAVLIAFAAAASMFTLAPSWASCIEIGGHSSGVLSATMNTSGQIGGMLSPVVLAYVIDSSANWALPIYIMAGLYAIATACWFVIDPTRTLKER